MDALSQLEVMDGELQQKLWALLANQAKRYTMGDSSSLPVEIMEELFRSILYTLRLYLEERGAGIGALAGADESQVFARAQERLAREIERGKRLYQAVLQSSETYGHRALEDTLQNIGIGLERYDWRFLAHVPPGEIDYQLFLPVPEETLGISYTEEYLWRLAAENAVLSRFDREECVRLFRSRFPDYDQLLVNLYEPVFCRALGRVLGNRPLCPPKLPACEADSLPLASDRERLLLAGRELCVRLNAPPSCRDYVEKCAAELWPRYRVASANHTLSNLF